ncbi:type-2 ice-structuring protein-like isoform X2 [Sparus aurata]|nr:type-2 ice-structuring protein-like isoform X2 [Sparus aurata]
MIPSSAVTKQTSGFLERRGGMCVVQLLSLVLQTSLDVLFSRQQKEEGDRTICFFLLKIVITLNICITTTMKMLTVSLLVCAIMALTRAADVPTGEPDLNSGPEAVPTGEPDLNSGPEGNSDIAEVAPSCPGNWTRYNDSCFFYVPSHMTWADAEKHCQTLGGNLASVHSFDEQHAIQSMIQRLTLGFPETWLGGYDATQEGTWFWSDGTDFSYTFWATGEPDDSRDADCLLMNYGDEEKFGDQPCDQLKPSACGKKL